MKALSARTRCTSPAERWRHFRRVEDARNDVEGDEALGIATAV